MPLDDRLRVSVDTVAALVAAQHPRWAHLPVTPLQPGGWDNLSFRLGPRMIVRLPAAARYAAQPARETAVLAALADRLPVAIPHILAQGQPGCGYPFSWSIRRWIEGAVVDAADTAMLLPIADDLAGFLRALWRCPSEAAPMPGSENFHRGGSLAVYAAAVDDALRRLDGAMDPAGARAVWTAAMAAPPAAAPVCVHGDVAPGNVLSRDGRLGAVIDWGLAARGDPACDLVMAWTVFDGPARSRFRVRLGAEPALWAKARGWALWKALLMLVGRSGRQRLERAPEAVLADLVADHRAG